MLLYMEFAGIHHKLLKQGLVNLNVNWLHFQKHSRLRNDLLCVEWDVKLY